MLITDACVKAFCCKFFATCKRACISLRSTGHSDFHFFLFSVSNVPRKRARVKQGEPSPSQAETPPESQKTPLSPDIPRTDTPKKTGEAQTLKEKQFDEWYKLYPRKVSKKKAREAFGKALKKIHHKDLIAMTKACINADETQETLKWENGKFIPYPTTWLNQERWENYRASLQNSFGIQTTSKKSLQKG